MPARVASVALSNDFYVITNGLHVSKRTISYVIVLNCISSELQYDRTVRCTIINRLLVHDYYLRPAELPQYYTFFKIQLVFN